MSLQVEDYCSKLSWYLVTIPAGSKGPTRFGWQQPEKALSVVAEKCGLSHPTVKGIASGDGVDHISLTTWKKLSEYLSDSQ